MLSHITNSVAVNLSYHWDDFTKQAQHIVANEHPRANWLTETGSVIAVCAFVSFLITTLIIIPKTDKTPSTQATREILSFITTCGAILAALLAFVSVGAWSTTIDPAQAKAQERLAVEHVDTQIYEATQVTPQDLCSLRNIAPNTTEDIPAPAEHTLVPVRELPLCKQINGTPKARFTELNAAGCGVNTLRNTYALVEDAGHPYRITYSQSSTVSREYNAHLNIENLGDL